MASNHAPSRLSQLLTGVDLASTNLRTLIFTLGHFMIDTVVISTITGAPLTLSGLAGIVSPLINGAWFWIMDRLWTSNHDRIHHGHGPVGQSAG